MKRLPVYANIEPLRWESDFFSRNSGKLVFDQAAPLLTPAALAAYPVVQAKVAAHCTRQADALASLGFRLVEGEIGCCVRLAPENLIDDTHPIPAGVPAVNPEAAWSSTVGPAAGQPGPPPVKPAATAEGLRVWRAEAGDIAVLRHLAAEAFTLSRFREPWYAARDSRRFYAQWAENAVLGCFDHLCLVVGTPAAIHGMVTLRDIADGEARIGLLAVDPAFRGQGIGRALFCAALDWCRHHQKTRLRVATQAGNLTALRLYIACGATIDSVAYWLYR